MEKNNITKGPIWKGMLSYFWALLLGAFFQQFYNTIDAVIVGRAVGSDGLGAVGGSAAMIVNLFVGFFMGLSSGATVVISQFYGADRKEEVQKAVHTSIALADCIRAIGIPVVEVHISDITKREAYRRHSYTAEACKKSIVGLGLKGYEVAILHLAEAQSM